MIARSIDIPLLKIEHLELAGLRVVEGYRVATSSLFRQVIDMS
jgi:hypothetical protein